VAGFLDLDEVEAGELTLKLSGASRASGSIKMADGDFDLSGASSVDLKGTARDGRASIRQLSRPGTQKAYRKTALIHREPECSGRLLCPFRCQPI